MCGIYRVWRGHSRALLLIRRCPIVGTVGGFIDRGEVRSAGSEGGMVALLPMRGCLVVGVGGGIVGYIERRTFTPCRVQCVAMHHHGESSAAEFPVQHYDL
jgi:hypothetical protein